jgi:hypothetical protein
VDLSWDIRMGKWSEPWRSSRADQVRNGRRDGDATDMSIHEEVARATCLYTKKLLSRKERLGFKRVSWRHIIFVWREAARY